MQKRKIRKSAILLAIIIILILYLIISMLVFIFKPNKEYLINQVGNLDAKTTYELYVNEDRNNPTSFGDYFFYGESLNLYAETYNQNKIVGNFKEIRFVDWINKENVIRMNLGNKIDEGIALNQLTDGFYSVYAVENENTQRLYYGESLSISFYTVTRNNEKKLIKLICDTNYFHMEEDESVETILDKAYLYVEVTTVTENKQYDIIISVDPALTTNMISPVGYQENGLVEQKELLDIAEIIKTDLEAEGLKVLIVYCAVDNINHEKDVLFYETDGSKETSVLETIYNSKAKYMLHLDLDEIRNKAFVHYSNYVSDDFAKNIYNQLQAVNFNGEIGVCSLSNGNDYAYEIRETGGKGLSAATYSEAAMKNEFAYNNIYGINTLEISYGNILNATRMTAFKENKEILAHNTAIGVLNYINK